MQLIINEDLSKNNQHLIHYILCQAVKSTA